MVNDIIKKGDDAEQGFNLPGLIQDCHALTKDFLDSLSDFEKTRRAAKPILDKLDELDEQLKGGEIPGDKSEIKAVRETLQDLIVYVTCPLTEVVRGSVVPMTDKTRLKLMSDVVHRLSGSTKIWFDIEKERWITEPNFRMWAKRLWLNIERTFEDRSIEMEDGSYRITELVARCVRDAAEPKRGQ